MDKTINVSEGELSSELTQCLEDNAPPPPVGERELTVQRAMEHPDWQFSAKTVRGRLDKLVKEGTMRKEERTGPSGVTYVYIPKS